MSANRSKRRILMCGGTFDPPHRAHIALAHAAAETLVCEELVFVPAAINPLKTASPPAAPEHRVAMLELALADRLGRTPARVDTVEIDRGGVSYTVDTLRALRDRYGPETELRLLIGVDAAVEFRRWKSWAEILELATPALLLRPPWTAASFERALAAQWEPGDVEQWLSWIIAGLPTMDVSATKVRESLYRGDWSAAEHMVGPSVLKYIREHGLYRDTSAGGVSGR